jgi:hypothetical protein
MANTIFLKGKPIRKEGIAGEAITPGHLLAINSSGNMIKHATAGGVTHLVAFENEIVGLDLNSAYASGDNVLYGASKDGQEVNLLVAAAAPAIVVGDLLQSAGNGTVAKVSSGTPLLRALQAVDNSGGGAAVRIIAEFL